MTITRISQARSIPRVVEPPPRPDRGDLETALDQARERKVRAAEKLAKAEQALQRGRDLLQSSHYRLAALGAQQAKANHGLAQKIRDWVAGGAEGERPQANRPSVSTIQALEQARVDHNAAKMALCDLEADKGKAQERDDIALTDVHLAARAILLEDAIDAAEELEDLERQEADLWHHLWGFAFAALPRGDGSSLTEPLPCGALVSRHINAPPREAYRQNLAPSIRTERGQQEVACVRAKFDALVTGTKVDDEPMEENEEPGPEAA